MDVGRMLAEAGEVAYPRYPGTPGDRQAIAWVEERLRDAGLEPERQEFSYDVRPAFRALRLFLVGAAGAVAAAGWLAGRAPLAALTLLAIALGAGAVFLTWAPGLERVYRGDGPTRTANVFAWRPARAVPRLTLILLAHHDSKSQNLTMVTRGLCTLAALAGVLALAAAVGLELAGGRPAPAVLTTAAAVLATTCLLALATLTSGNRSPGGVDNAGSLAIVLELARRLPARLPGDVEVFFLSPGAEEDHMVGAMRWLDVWAERLTGRPVWALNLDGAGIPGRVTLLERYGFGRLFSPHLSGLARQAALDLDIPVRGVLLPPAMGVDAIPFAHRGIDCLTLASGSLGRATLAVHSERDVAANLDPRALGEAARLAEAMARRLAAPTQRKAPGP